MTAATVATVNVNETATVTVIIGLMIGKIVTATAIIGTGIATMRGIVNGTLTATDLIHGTGIGTMTDLAAHLGLVRLLLLRPLLLLLLVLPLLLHLLLPVHLRRRT